MHEHFWAKRKFAAFDPAVLADYLARGTEGHADGRARLLSFRREVETAIYNTMPHGLLQEFKRHPFQCPVAFIGGTRSLEMKQVGMAMTHRLVGSSHPERLVMIEGSHLFPMEQPLETAAAINTMLQALS